MKKLIGIVMMASIFVGLFVMGISMIGLIDTIITFASVIGLAVFIGVACYLITDGK